MRTPGLARLACTVALAGVTNALQVDVSSVQSVSDAAKTIATNIISLYQGKDGPAIPGLFPNPYYWWESGLAWDSLINYWSLTGDDSFNDQINDGILWQVSDTLDFMPPNQTKSLGNDDQSTWALAAMTAAEKGFPAPQGTASNGNSSVKSWVQLAQNVFDDQTARWDTETCGGGLRWQIYTFNAGYDYKNALSNGNFMQLAARLGAYTKNQTYVDWVLKASRWSSSVGLISNGTYDVYDGANTEQQCRKPNRIQWTSNAGTYISAYSYLGNNAYVPELLDSAFKVFASKSDIITEVACGNSGKCNTDQLAFKAILARALANAKYVDIAGNFDTNALDSVLKASAEGAAAQCSGGPDGSSCGSDWSSSTYDGSTGLGQELSALEIMLALIPNNSTQTSNGTSTPTGTTGGASGTSSGSATPTHAGTNGANASSRSIVGLLGALAIALAFA